MCCLPQAFLSSRLAHTISPVTTFVPTTPLPNPIAMSSVLALSFVPAQLTQLVQILSNKTLPAFAKTFTPKSCSATLKMIGMKNNFTSVILDGTHLRITFQLRSKLAYLISIEYSWHHSNIAKLVPICQHPSNNASWHYATTKIC